MTICARIIARYHNGVYAYLEKNDALTGDEQHDNLLSEGVAFSLYCKTGFPKTAGIHLSGLPYSYRENAEFVKEMYIQAELLAEEIDEAYEGKLQEVKVIDDTEEETVTDEPIIRGGEVEQINEPLAEETEALPEQDDEVFVSPVYRQYLEAQKINPQAVVLLRLGDFYEIMGENARTVAEELDLTLTSREVGLPERVPMCGFRIMRRMPISKKSLLVTVCFWQRPGRNRNTFFLTQKRCRLHKPKFPKNPNRSHSRKS